MICVQCEEGISNPICESCLTTSVQEWLMETKPELMHDVEGFVFDYGLSTSWCIKCTRAMPVCTHCFSKEVFALIQAKAPELEEEFMRQFNYQIYFW